MKDHKPIVIEEFKGLWANGDLETCPLNHFSECNNIAFGESSFETRPGLDTFGAGTPIYQQEGVTRMYNYVMKTGETLLILTSQHNIYHSLLDGSETVYGPILHIDKMEDFEFHSANGFAYITPIKTYEKATGEKYQTGVDGEFVYVYKGDGTPARKAAGLPPVNGGETSTLAYNSNQIGVIDEGIHLIGVAFANDTEISVMGPQVFPVVYAPGDQSIIINRIPIGPTGTTKRNIYITKAIPQELWDPALDHAYYLAKTIEDNTSTSTAISVKDSDLTLIHAATGSLPTPTSGGMALGNSLSDGYCDLGLHVVGVVFETDTGYITAPGPEFFAVQTYVYENKAIDVYNIPTSPDPAVVKRHLVSSVALNYFNGNNKSNESEFQFFYIPGGTIEDNTTTQKTISYYDSELIEDASHLIDNFPEIPAGVGLGSYNGRMALWGIHDDMSVCYFSAKNEPEAFDQVEGFVKFPQDGKPLTNGQEFRDTFYLFKQTKTAAVNDNGQTPAFWEGPVILDHGLGASVHGICKVLDSDGVNVDYILVVDWSGIMVFRGAYLFPALTFKIDNLWHALARNDFANIQIMNDSIEHRIYMTLPNKQMLYGDWSDGLDAKNVKWSPWTFDIETTTIAMVETNHVLIGSEKLMESVVKEQRWPRLKRTRRM